LDRELSGFWNSARSSGAKAPFLVSSAGAASPASVAGCPQRVLRRVHQQHGSSPAAQLAPAAGCATGRRFQRHGPAERPGHPALGDGAQRDVLRRRCRRGRGEQRDDKRRRSRAEQNGDERHLRVAHEAARLCKDGGRRLLRRPQPAAGWPQLDAGAGDLELPAERRKLHLRVVPLSCSAQCNLHCCSLREHPVHGVHLQREHVCRPVCAAVCHPSKLNSLRLQPEHDEQCLCEHVQRGGEQAVVGAHAHRLAVQPDCLLRGRLPRRLPGVHPGQLHERSHRLGALRRRR